jgi:hypothetical protein
MSTTVGNNKDEVSSDICANCGKGEESSNSLKACTACKMVKYCNRECQIAHRSQHKKACKKRAAELYDELLFKQPPTLDDCPICFLRLPYLDTGRRFYGCCGKYICSGCIYAPVYDHQGNMLEKTCPFCRTPESTSDEEIIKRNEKLVEAGDAEAITNMGYYYKVGMYGLPQDHNKALEFYHRAGTPTAYSNIAIAYDTGIGVELDEKKARHYYELAAMGGHAGARHNLGCCEGDTDYDRAVKHFMIAVRSGEAKSLKTTQELFKRGYTTKDNYMKALISYQAYLDEIKSDQRDKAAAANEDYKYIE